MPNYEPNQNPNQDPNQRPQNNKNEQGRVGTNVEKDEPTAEKRTGGMKDESSSKH